MILCSSFTTRNGFFFAIADVVVRVMATVRIAIRCFMFSPVGFG